MKPRSVFGLVLLALAVAQTAPAQARTLIDATDQLCDEVKKFLDSEGKSKVRIGQFIGKGPEALRASSSPLLREAIRISLQKKQIAIVDGGAHFELTGSYQAIEDTLSHRQAVTLSVTLDDLNGNERRFKGVVDGKATIFFDNLPDVAKVLSIPSYAPPGREPDLKPGVDYPQCHFDGTRILAGRGAPFAIEILVAPETQGKRKLEDYAARAPRDEKGLAFVPIKRGEAYGVQLHNLADFDVAVDLRLDGINMYYFDEKRDKNKPAYHYVVLGPKSSVVIRGWYVTLNDSDEFLVVPREKSVFAQLSAGNPAEVGTITALFHRAWDKKQPRPTDEPANPKEHSLSADATGRGQRFEQKYIEVDYAVGTFRGSVTARYTK